MGEATEEEKNIDLSNKRDQEIDKNTEEEIEPDGFWGSTMNSIKKYAPKIIKKLLG